MNFPDVLSHAVALSGSYDAIPGIIEDEIPEAKLIQDEQVSSGRWHIDHEAVYEYLGKYWQVWYAEPATENQDWDKEEYSVHEVTPITVTVTKYVRVK